MKYLKPVTLYQELLKSQARSPSRLLSLDVGDKYVGLAISDVNNRIALPLSVLLRKKTNIELMACDFQLLISEFNLSGFIVGYPLDRRRMRQHCSPEAVQVKLFIDGLRKTGLLEDLRYTFWDECFTSKAVEVVLKRLDMHPVHRKTVIDKLAAVGILQGYLDEFNRNESLKSIEYSED